jgi:hypothetical protein
LGCSQFSKKKDDANGSAAVTSGVVQFLAVGRLERMKLFYATIFVFGFVCVAFTQETNASIRAIFKDYDFAARSKIIDHWSASLDSIPPTTPQPSGKVVVEFRLFPDGHVSDLKASSSTVDDRYVSLCNQAITNSAAFESWSPLIRLAYTNDFRVIRYTFDYVGDKTPPNTALEQTPVTP